MNRRLTLRLALALPVAFSALLEPNVAAIAAVKMAPVLPARIQLERVAVGELVSMLFRDVLSGPYIIGPDVAGDRRLVSISLSAAPASLRAEVLRYVRAIGLVVTTVAGVDQITTANAGGMMPGGSSLSRLDTGTPVQSMAPTAPVVVPDDRVAVYQPRHRSPEYLSEVLRGMLPAMKLGVRAGPQAQGDKIIDPVSPDWLVFSGTDVDVATAVRILGVVDSPPRQVAIRATVYEVATGHANGSALQLAVSLLGGQFGAGVLGANSVGDAFARFTSKNVQAVFSALNSDNRFRVVTSPSLVARSGSEAVLSSGSQVPVLGSVSYAGDSARSVQSVQYRDSGVILRVSPVVHMDGIDVHVSQELSNFVKTDTGVNASPTLNKRSLVSDLTVKSGEVIVLGGLTEERETRATSGFLKGWVGTRNHEKTRTEILLVLQVVALGASGADGPERSEDRTAALVPAVLGGTK